MFAKAIAIASLMTLPLAACQAGGGMQPWTGGLTGAGTPLPAAGQASVGSCAGDAVLSDQMAQAVNAARMAEGKVVLGRNSLLDQIALSHACDMAATGQATVAGSNGSSVVDRARAVGYPTCGVVQLVAVGGMLQGVVGRWLTSMPHRTEVLGQPSAEIGAGLARDPGGRLWWSVVMGEEC